MDIVFSLGNMDRDRKCDFRELFQEFRMYIMVKESKKMLNVGPFDRRLPILQKTITNCDTLCDGFPEGLPIHYRKLLLAAHMS